MSTVQRERPNFHAIPVGDPAQAGLLKSTSEEMS